MTKRLVGGVHIQAPPTSMETSIWSRAFKRQQKWEDKVNLVTLYLVCKVLFMIFINEAHSTD